MRSAIVLSLHADDYARADAELQRNTSGSFDGKIRANSITRVSLVEDPRESLSAATPRPSFIADGVKSMVDTGIACCCCWISGNAISLLTAAVLFGTIQRPPKFHL